MNEEIKTDVYLVGDLFRELIIKYNKLQSKKRLYKGIKELTIIEINTIVAIGKETRSMSQLANNLDVTSGTSTITIDRLINKGYVERIRDLEDRRQVFVKLSDEGIKAYDSIEEIKNRVIEKIFGVLSEEERRMLIGVMEKMNNGFDSLFLTEGI